LTLNVFAQGAAAVRKYYHRHSLELTQPYWDRRLIEFVMALPADQLGRPGRKRRLQRNAMVGRLPEAVRERVERTSFVPLLKKGLLDKERTAVTTMLRDPLVVGRNMIRAEWLEEKLEQLAMDPSDGHLWQCISLELWLRRYWN
jgi:asparagine synthase (glutamine-hydrolysing)